MGRLCAVNPSFPAGLHDGRDPIAVRKSQGSRPMIDPMNAIATSPSTSRMGRKMLNKVPEITLYFWLIKVLCTTVGETAADYLSTNVGWGADTTMAATGGLLAALLAIQFSLKRYIASAYWACVVVISVFGTQITDKLTDTYNVPLTTTTPVFAVILALVFAAWYAAERTLSIHSILAVRREAFYWLAILFTFALGTAAGDLVAEKFTLGYAVSVALFAGVIATVAVAHFRFGLWLSQ